MVWDETKSNQNMPGGLSKSRHREKNGSSLDVFERGTKGLESDADFVTRLGRFTSQLSPVKSLKEKTFEIIRIDAK